MLKQNTFNLVLCVCLMACACTGSLFAAPFIEDGTDLVRGVDYEHINGLRYYKTMFDAKRSVDYLKVPTGIKPFQVGGSDQDKDLMTSGMPPAFKPVKDGNVWVLDSINGYLKLFSQDGKLKEMKNLSFLDAKLVVDFDVSENGVFVYLDRILGKIYVVLEDEIVTVMETFNDANAIRLSADGTELLVDLPIAGGVVRVNLDGDLMGIYKGDTDLTLYESSPGRLFGLRIEGKTAVLYIRNSYTEGDETVVAKFPYGAYKGVEYKVKEIAGVDKDGHVHLSLMAMNDLGIIYRDRIYKCSSEGKILDYADIISIPSPSLSLMSPRNRMVSPSGVVMGFHCSGEEYVVYSYK